MSILHADEVDVVAARPETGVVRLIVSDPLSWRDFRWHARLLHDKVDAYVTFVESGQLLATALPTLPPSPEVRIVLASRHPPTEEAHELFAAMRDFLRSLGIGFDVEVG